MRKLLAALLILSALLACATASAAPSIVNFAKNKLVSSSLTNSIAYTPASGNSVDVLFNCGDSGVTTASISDTAGWTWHTDFAFATASGSAAISAFRADGVTAVANTITVTTDAVCKSTLMLVEANGTSGFDKVSTIHGGFNTTVATNSITPAASGELALMFMGDAGSSVTYGTFTGGFTQGDAQTGAPSASWGWQVAGSGAVVGGATVSTTTSHSEIALLYPASGAASCTHEGWLSNGTIAVPTASSTTVWRKDGSFGTVDCSSTQYYQPKNGGAFGVN